jgi:hypothetical protein
MSHSGELSAAFSDTSPEAEARYYERLRATPPLERLKTAFRLSERVRNATMSDLKTKMPGASRDELALAFVRRVYGDEIAAQFEEQLRAR